MSTAGGSSGSGTGGGDDFNAEEVLQFAVDLAKKAGKVIVQGSEVGVAAARGGQGGEAGESQWRALGRK